VRKGVCCHQEYNSTVSIVYKPRTTLGNWSVRLIVISILFFLVLAAFIASGQRGGDTFFSNLSLALPMLIAAILAVCAFFTGILSIIKNRERAVFVFISTVIGSFVLFFMLAEILFPH
jgi:cytochrome bd-type quinol oxidase subunit 2